MIHRWLVCVPLATLTLLSPARASEIRDTAGLFDPGAVRRAQAELERIERQFRVPVTIETIPSLDGRNVNDVAVLRDRQLGNRGLYILMAQQEHRISNVLIPGSLKARLSEPRLLAVRDAFTAEFKQGNFNGGLGRGVAAIEETLSVATAAAGRPLATPASRPPGAPVGAAPGGRPAVGVVPAPRPGGGTGLGPLIMLGLVIVAVLIGIRLLGRLFSGGRPGYGGPASMGRPGGYGYGGGGYGGGGGGFFSSLFGGLGGAIAGNWMYDQFSGRHQHGGEYQGGSVLDPGGPPASAGGDEIAGADYGGGQGADWGGGDAGAGGDWGGSAGGDWGGGGSDGGGGGDW